MTKKQQQQRDYAIELLQSIATLAVMAQESLRDDRALLSDDVLDNLDDIKRDCAMAVSTVEQFLQGA